MKYSFIAQHKKTWLIDPMCRVLGVKRNGYYRFQKLKLNQPEDPRHQTLLQCVKVIAAANDYCYGSRRMQIALIKQGYVVGRHKARSLMKEAMKDQALAKLQEPGMKPLRYSAPDFLLQFLKSL